MTADTAVANAREALARCDWAAAYDLLAGVAGETADADTLETLADAAWWTSRLEECIAVRERAYALHEEAGDRRAGVEKPAEIVPALERARKMNADGKAVLLEFITSEEIEFSHRRAF